MKSDRDQDEVLAFWVNNLCRVGDLNSNFDDGTVNIDVSNQGFSKKGDRVNDPRNLHLPAGRTLSAP